MCQYKDTKTIHPQTRPPASAGGGANGVEAAGPTSTGRLSPRPAAAVLTSRRASVCAAAARGRGRDCSRAAPGPGTCPSGSRRDSGSVRRPPGRGHTR